MSWLNTLSALSGRNFLAEWRKSCFSCAKVQAAQIKLSILIKELPEAEWRIN